MIAFPAIGLGARLLGVRKALAKVPWQVWAALALALSLWLGTRWHAHQVKVTIAAAEKRGEDRAYAAIDKQAREIERKAASVASRLRNFNNETNRAIDRDADDLRLRGPGKAAYRCPAAPAGPSRQQPPGGPADVAVDPLPDRPGTDLIVMPFAGTVAAAEQCDRNRAEVLTRREYDSQLLAIWPTETEDRP